MGMKHPMRHLQRNVTLGKSDLRQRKVTLGKSDLRRCKVTLGKSDLRDRKKPSDCHPRVLLFRRSELRPVTAVQLRPVLLLLLQE